MKQRFHKVLNTALALLLILGLLLSLSGCWAIENAVSEFMADLLYSDGPTVTPEEEESRTPTDSADTETDGTSLP